MSKKRNSDGGFGSNIEEVDQNIQSLESERKDLADKINQGKVSGKESKRFDEIGNILVDANKFRSELQPVQGQVGNEDFVIDQKTVIGTDNNGNPGGPSLVIPEASSGQANAVPGIDLGGQGDVQTPGIAPIELQSDPNQNIVQQTLGGVNRPDGPTNIGQEINTATFGAGSNQKGFNGVKPGSEPLIQQGERATLGINDPILKGNVSGQIIGNQPIFVGGGDFLATDMLNNRRKAIQDAANQRAAEAQELLNQKPPLIKDQAFQSSLNQQFYSSQENFIKKAQDAFGEDWDLKLKDQTNPLGREFVQTMDNFEFIAAASDQVTDEIAEVKKDLDDGSQVFSDGTLQILDEYQSLSGQFANGDVQGQISLREKFEELQGYKGLDKILKDDGVDVKGTVTQYASILEDNDKYVTTTQKKTAYEDQLKVIAKDIADNQMRNPVRKGLISEEQIFDHMNALYGYENIISKDIKNKPTPPGGIKINLDLGTEFGEEKIEKVGGADFTVVDAIEIPTNTKPLSASGLTVINADGTTNKVDGVRDIDMNSYQVVKVPNKNNPNEFDLKKVVVGTHTEKVEVSKGKFEDKTFTNLYDLEEIGSRVKTDQLQNPQQWEDMNNRFDEKINGSPKIFDIDKPDR